MYSTSHFGLGKTCEKLADKLVNVSGHMSTVGRQSPTSTTFERVKALTFTHFIRPFLTSLSTINMPRSAPVYEAVIRTFHSAYNNHYEVYKLER